MNTNNNTDNNNDTNTALQHFECADVAAVLSGLVDDVVSANVRHQAERHMVTCASCMQLLDEAEAMDSLLAVSMDEVQELPEGFEAAVLNATTRSHALQPLKYKWFARSGWLAAAASLALAGYVWINPATSSNNTNNPAGTVADLNNNLNDKNTHLDPASNSFVNAADGNMNFVSYYPLGSEVVSSPMENYLEPIDENFIPVDAHVSTADDKPSADHATATAVRSFDSFTPALGLESAKSSAIVLDRPMFFNGQPRLFRDDKDTLHRVAEVLEMLIDFEGGSLKTAEEMRKIIELENLLSRSEIARGRIAAEHQFTLLNAESILYRIVYGPIAEFDLREMRDAARTVDLIGRIDRLSGRKNLDSSM